MLTKAEQKENAIKNLNRIGSYKPYTRAFEKGVVTMYEGYGGYYVEEDELLKKIKEIENKYGGTVYAVIHQITNIGELYTMLWTGQAEDESGFDVEDYGTNMYYVRSYVWNKTYEDCSEFGDVVIQPALGGLIRLF